MNENYNQSGAEISELERLRREQENAPRPTPGITAAIPFSILEKDHADMVNRLAKPPGLIIAHLTTHSYKAHGLHMAVGVSGEAGEILDVIKRIAIYGKHETDLNKEGVSFKENLIEELGDMEFYLEGIRQCFDISREETLEHNINKLDKGAKARYASGTYSDDQANARADKTSVN